MIQHITHPLPSHGSVTGVAVSPHAPLSAPLCGLLEISYVRVPRNDHIEKTRQRLSIGLSDRFFQNIDGMASPFPLMVFFVGKNGQLNCIRNPTLAEIGVFDRRNTNIDPANGSYPTDFCLWRKNVDRLRERETTHRSSEGSHQTMQSRETFLAVNLHKRNSSGRAWGGTCLLSNIQRGASLPFFNIQRGSSP